MVVAAARRRSLVTADLLTRGWLERMDLRVSEVVSDWGLRDSGRLPVRLVGRPSSAAGSRSSPSSRCLVGYLGWRRHTWLPLLRVLVALGLLTVVVYAIKQGTGRTAPGFPGPSSSTPTASPSRRATWPTPCSCGGSPAGRRSSTGCPLRVQRAFWLLSVVGPVVTGLAMVSLDFHWITDAVVGACVGVLLLGVVHALDAVVLSRWVRARAGRQTA